MIMYGQKLGDHFDHIHKSAKMVRLYGPDDVYELDVCMSSDQTPETKSSGFTQDYWAWIETGTLEFTMVYPSWPQFSMCFPYGVRGAEEKKQGNAYRVTVKEIRKV
ncbi:MAG: hypothetical protein WC437_04955 [Patescibacteria group bacterium]|jgi:hypothetical protein